MQGLEVSRRFFLEWGLPYLRQRFPARADRMAAGLFRGSQVLDAALRQACEPQPPVELAQRSSEICEVVHEMLGAAGLASQDLTGHPHTLFCDQAAVLARLELEQTDMA